MNIIKLNFSKYAKSYDEYANIQKHCAAKLIRKIESGMSAPNKITKILDIGCGTGIFTELLRDRFTDAEISAMDISPEMIKIAKDKLTGRQIKFITADAEKIPFKSRMSTANGEKFNLIGSNASFQWFENLDWTLKKYKGMLEADGILLFSVFGPQTFFALNESLKELLGKKTAISSANFIKKEVLNKILKKYFKSVSIEEEMIEENYNTLLELLKKIKYTGVRGNGVERGNLWTAGTIRKLEKIYIRRFKELRVTYQIFYCKAGAE